MASNTVSSQKATAVGAFLLLLGGVFLRAQDPLQLLPKNYGLVFENEFVRVIRVHYGPHEKLPVHDHPVRPTVYVYLSESGPVRFSHVETQAFKVDRAPVKAGAIRISPGRLEKHEVENLSDLPSDFLRVELKTIPLGDQAISFREKAPDDLSKSRVAVDFDSPVLAVRRIVAGAGSGKQHYSATAGLLVAFTPARIGGDGKELRAGDVFWAPAKFDVEDERKGVHLLWITVK
jgi:hypothetical protein